MCLPLRTLTLRTSYLNLSCARPVVCSHFLYAQTYGISHGLDTKLTIHHYNTCIKILVNM